MRYLPASRMAFAAAALLISCVAWEMTWAGTGMVYRTPPPNIRNTTGLKLAVDTQWVDATGYRVIRIHVSTATGAASAADREVSIDVMPSNYGMNEGAFVTRQTVVLPQGATSATAQMLVPQNQPWHEVTTRVSVDGRHSEILSKRISTTNSGGEWSEAVPSILVIDSDAPTLLNRDDQLMRFNRNSRSFPRQTKLHDIRALEMVVNREAYGSVNNQRPRDMEILRRVTNTPRLELLPPADLPQRWLGLTCFDLVIIGHDDLVKMSTQNTPQFQALVDWAATGGNLLVFGLGDQYGDLRSIETMLAFSPVTADGDYLEAGWKPAERRHFHNQALRTYQNLESYYRGYDESFAEEPMIPANSNINRAFTTENQHKFLYRPLGFGLVLAMATSEPFPSTTTEWSWVLNTVGESRMMWYRRHGLSLRRQNNDFWDFLVPNTGKAPVFVFCALITLFAIIIGPVNYFVLARQRRLYLLLATIPGGAALVTFCLISYAVLADGLGTQVRMRSYTLVDQNAGRAVNWSRQSYYSGMAPSRGMTFPADTAVYTVEQFPQHEDDSSFRRQKIVHWGEGDEETAQNLRKGYLTSRITSQFITLRTGKSTAALQLDQRDGPTSVRNQLGGEIALLLLSDASGQIYVARDVPAGEKASLKSADFAEAKGEFHEIFLDARPTRPDGLDPNQFERWSMQQWYGWNLIDSGLSEPRMATGRLEDRLRWAQNVRKKDFPTATYIAVLKTSPETPIGIRSRESGSLHLVEGKF